MSRSSSDRNEQGWIEPIGAFRFVSIFTPVCLSAMRVSPNGLKPLACCHVSRELQSSVPLNPPAASRSIEHNIFRDESSIIYHSWDNFQMRFTGRNAGIFAKSPSEKGRKRIETIQIVPGCLFSENWRAKHDWSVDREFWRVSCSPNGYNKSSWRSTRTAKVRCRKTE